MSTTLPPSEQSGAAISCRNIEIPDITCAAFPTRATAGMIRQINRRGFVMIVNEYVSGLYEILMR
jgi:hypothetical protein